VLGSRRRRPWTARSIVLVSRAYVRRDRGRSVLHSAALLRLVAALGARCVGTYAEGFSSGPRECVIAAAMWARCAQPTAGLPIGGGSGHRRHQCLLLLCLRFGVTRDHRSRHHTAGSRRRLRACGPAEEARAAAHDRRAGRPLRGRRVQHLVRRRPTTPGEPAAKDPYGLYRWMSRRRSLGPRPSHWRRRRRCSVRPA